jgi:hypothetical protein
MPHTGPLPSEKGRGKEVQSETATQRSGGRSSREAVSLRVSQELLPAMLRIALQAGDPTSSLHSIQTVSLPRPAKREED